MSTTALQNKSHSPAENDPVCALAPKLATLTEARRINFGVCVVRVFVVALSLLVLLRVQWFSVTGPSTQAFRAPGLLFQAQSFCIRGVPLEKPGHMSYKQHKQDLTDISTQKPVELLQLRVMNDWSCSC